MSGAATSVAFYCGNKRGDYTGAALGPLDAKVSDPGSGDGVTDDGLHHRVVTRDGLRFT
jgi:hypothetical protein